MSMEAHKSLKSIKWSNTTLFAMKQQCLPPCSGEGNTSRWVFDRLGCRNRWQVEFP